MSENYIPPLKMLSILKVEMSRKEVQQILNLKDEKHVRPLYPLDRFSSDSLWEKS
jgi:hypothetical protein